MRVTDSTVITLCVVVLSVGVVIVSGYYDARDQAQQASQQGHFGRVEPLGVMIRWMNIAFQLLVLNLFVTGVALIAAGVELHRVNQLKITTESNEGEIEGSE